MNVQKIIFSVVFIFVFFVSSCCSNEVHTYGTGASEVRNDLRELGEQQAGSAVTSTVVETAIAESTRDVERIESTVESGASDIEEFKDILRKIRERAPEGVE